MKLIFTIIAIASTTLSAYCSEPSIKLYKKIKTSNPDLFLHKVFKQNGLSRMKLESKPFHWLNDELKDIVELDKLRFETVASLDFTNPTGNGCISESRGELTIKIPDAETKKGNGLDYKWFSLVWGIEYFKKQNEIQRLIKSYKNNEISQDKMVAELARIRVQVIINVRKFYDDIWTPWCVEVGAIPNSPLTWLKHVEVKNPDILLKNLADAGDLARIEEWVRTLQK